MSRERSTYRHWELLLILIGVLLSAASAYFYFSNDSPIRKLLGWMDDNSLVEIASIEVISGEVRRSKWIDRVLGQVDSGTLLYNSDVIVTGTESRARIQLKNGDAIDLGPNTMIRLSFETAYSLRGIERSTLVRVFRGAVQGPESVKITRLEPRIAPPQKTLSFKEERAYEEPQAFILHPADQSVFAIPDGSRIASLPLEMRWELKQEYPRIHVRIFRMTDHGASEIFNRVIATSKGKGGFKTQFTRPGTYSWEISYPEEAQLPPFSTQARFSIRPEFKAIEIAPPLIGGKTRATNRLDQSPKEQFDIRFSWTPYPAAKKYLIRFFSPKTNRIVTERHTPSPSYITNRGRVFVGSLEYQVFALLDSGFRPYSPRTSFQFDFLPPRPVLPMDGARITTEQLAREKNMVLLTWERTHFTKFYEIELSRSSDFKKTDLKYRVKENFFLMESPGIGTYWWRVKSSSGKRISSPSPVYRFTISSP